MTDPKTSRKLELQAEKELKAQAKELRATRLRAMLQANPTLRACEAGERLGISGSAASECARRIGLSFVRQSAR